LAIGNQRKQSSQDDANAVPDENVLYITINRYLKDNLNDPNSLQDLEIRSVSRLKNSGSFRVVAFYRASNAFGAIIAKQQAFILTNAPLENRNTLFFHVRPE